MTWTLRFYDEVGTKIAWVRADPYGWEIAHPNGGWDWLERSISLHEDPVMVESGGLESPDGIELPDEVLVNYGETPKEHLELVERELSGYDDIADADLTDE